MNIRGTLEQLISSGYERRLIVRSGGWLVCCALLQHDEYLEPDQHSRHFGVGSVLALGARIRITGELSVMSARTFYR